MSAIAVGIVVGIAVIPIVIGLMIYTIWDSAMGGEVHRDDGM